jgi:hypothetical protein
MKGLRNSPGASINDPCRCFLRGELLLSSADGRRLVGEISVEKYFDASFSGDGCTALSNSPPSALLAGE